MRGGKPAFVLPAGYLGSSVIGAALLTCGFDLNAAKVAALIISAIFLITLYWARKDPLMYSLCAMFAILLIIAWLVADVRQIFDLHY